MTEPVLILGMHRSGTSCLAGSLEECGLYLGEVSTKERHNPKGNRENRAIMHLHNDILERVGAAWDQPPTTLPNWTDAELQRLKTITDEFPKDKLWGVKDPRLLFTMPGWQALFSPKLIGTFRHPAETVASLVSRAKEWKTVLEPQDAYDLWAAYNFQMMELFERENFTILRYDIPVSEYHDKLSHAVTEFGLTLDRPAFRDETMHIQRKTDEVIPERHRSLWERLNAAAI